MQRDSFYLYTLYDKITVYIIYIKKNAFCTNGRVCIQFAYVNWSSVKYVLNTYMI